ncbi:hypothetical protein ElyMa_004004700 [Elysia marginata]|uniref:Uncharacterized protein n=1 Tax=Elysia marginata TaxID=1093978 RepID=A0AAV4G1G6_9GAST|nr:hypothetical protein ElyMa_004004700 [Elysia marginata]
MRVFRMASLVTKNYWRLYTSSLILCFGLFIENTASEAAAEAALVVVLVVVVVVVVVVAVVVVIVVVK